MPDLIRASISLKSMRVPELQVLPSLRRTQRTSISLLRRTLAQGEEVTPAELVSESDGKTRGLSRPYAQSVFKTSLFSGRRPRRRPQDCRLDLVFNERRVDSDVRISRERTCSQWTRNKRKPTFTLIFVTVLLRRTRPHLLSGSRKNSRSRTRRDSPFVSRWLFPTFPDTWLAFPTLRSRRFFTRGRWFVT